MSYSEAMAAAGAEIIAYKSFGSYQGDWWALVRYNGALGWVNGSYGSCSGCDAFEAEFGHISGGRCSEHEYVYPKPESCAACDAAEVEYQRRLADFGRGYLDGLLSQHEAETQAARHIDWDSDAPAMLAFVQHRRGEATDSEASTG